MFLYVCISLGYNTVQIVLIGFIDADYIVQNPLQISIL